jgi:hypothetical protein
LQFAPIGNGKDRPGKPGAGKIQPDGSFTVNTYGDGDGAVIGIHTLTFVAPPPRPEKEAETTSSGDPSQSGPLVRSSFENLVPEQERVTIEPGNNNLLVNLVKPPS